MKNWKKVILGVALSFMILFTCVGYAALNDQLSISGMLNASEPEGVYITKITSIEQFPTTWTYPRTMQTTITGSAKQTITYAIEFKNNTDQTQVYTGSNAGEALSAWTDVDGNEEEYKAVSYSSEKATADDYVSSVSGIPVEPGKSITINIQYTLPNDVPGETVQVEFYFDEVDYTITYINNSQILDVRCVLNWEEEVATANSTAKDKVDQYIIDEELKEKITFKDTWMNAGSTQKITIKYTSEEEVEDVILYPIFDGLYTASFVDQNGTILGWTLFTADPAGKTIVTTKAGEITAPAISGFVFEYWQVQIRNGDTITKTKLEDTTFNSSTIKGDITIYPVYKFNGDVQLVPVDNDGDGETDEYQVGGYNANTGGQALVVIPNDVNGVPVTVINADAFSSYDDLHSVVIPASVTTINAQAFTANQGNQYIPTRDTVTLYYAGDPATWKEYMDEYNADNYDNLKEKWDNNMGDGSRVFFLVDGKVDPNAGYWELDNDWVWYFHDHAYTYEAALVCTLGESSHHEYGGGIFGWGDSLQAEEFTNYAGACDCTSCGGADRPDKDYWPTTTTASDEEVAVVDEAEEVAEETEEAVEETEEAAEAEETEAEETEAEETEAAEEVVEEETS